MVRYIKSRSQRRFGALQRYAPYIRAAVGAYRTLSTARSGGFSNRRSSTGYGSTIRRGGGSRGVTGHYDKANIYGRKRMPYARKRRWVQFVRKVQAVQHKSLGTNSVVYNSKYTDSTVVDAQYANAAVLYGGTGTTGFGNNDLARLKSHMPADPAVTSKIMMKSAVLDMTFTNTGVNAIELDIYQFIVKHDAQFDWIQPLFADAAAGTNAIPNTTYDISINQVGVTPFQLPGASFYMRWLSKKKYFIPVGSSITYQTRDAKNRIFNTERINDAGTAFIAGWTRGILWIQKGVPSYDPVGGVTEGSSATTMSFGCTRTYSYCVNETNPNADGYSNT